MSNHPTILATYQPQAWVNDYATDIDGAFTYDVTEHVLDLAVTNGWNWVTQNLTDYSDTAEFHLWENTNERTDHNGPFVIKVEWAIEDYLDAFTDANGRVMTVADTQARLDALRATQTTQQAPTVPAAEPASTGAYRVCVTFDAANQEQADALALAVAEALRTATTFPNPYRMGVATQVA